MAKSGLVSELWAFIRVRKKWWLVPVILVLVGVGALLVLAHGSVLASQFGEPVRDIVLDRRAAGLDEIDVAVMDLAERVVADATSIGDADLRPLRDLGLTQTEIMDVVLAAAARCFFSKALDALGVLPDAGYRDLEAELREALVVGRPIADV